MIKRRKLVAGNWKMNINILLEAKKLVQSVKKKTAKVRKTDIVFCPPNIYLQALAPMMKGKWKLGAQDAFYEDGASHTGQVSAKQLKQFGVSYVIVGHSERRRLGETDEMVAKKVQAVLRAGITPILCIGEWTRDDNGDYLAFVRDQLTACLKGVSKGQITDVVVMYEPVWAISPNPAMNARDIHEMVLYLRKCLTNMFAAYASRVQIIYGGSASPENAADIITNGMAEGLLPGRDSLDAERFSEIIKIVDKA